MIKIIKYICIALSVIFGLISLMMFIAGEPRIALTSSSITLLCVRLAYSASRHKESKAEQANTIQTQAVTGPPNPQSSIPQPNSAPTTSLTPMTLHEQNRRPSNVMSYFNPNRKQKILFVLFFGIFISTKLQIFPPRATPFWLYFCYFLFAVTVALLTLYNFIKLYKQARKRSRGETSGS